MGFIRLVLLCLIILSGCKKTENNINDNYQFDTTVLTKSEKTIQYETHATDYGINNVGIMTDGNIIIKYDEYLDGDLVYYYSIIKNGNIKHSFILNSREKTPDFLLTNDDKIIVSIFFVERRRGYHFVPAIYNLKTLELENVIKRSRFFPVTTQIKTPDYDVVSMLIPNRSDIRNQSNPFRVSIHTMKNDGKYNVKPASTRIYRDDIRRLLNVCPGNKKDEMLLLYNIDDAAVIEIYNYEKQYIVKKYILPKQVNEKRRVIITTDGEEICGMDLSYDLSPGDRIAFDEIAITFSPDRSKIIVYNDMFKLIVICLETNNYTEIGIPERLRSRHDWAWDSTSVVFVSETNNLYHFHFNE